MSVCMTGVVGAVRERKGGIGANGYDVKKNIKIHSPKCTVECTGCSIMIAPPPPAKH